ncbi:DUF2019 domain-containing protein [Hyalangium rubrum]|uniref:DUF2019 domain-containing protein n=1 Tax=Hyalangium rubrum TaxID=3103134 RepID=A0ABU5HJJ1_9BACT|nr:DUF2019 domain-containing protein [Hyalangium sp. s54d21]MDY7233317.1 DUF2019 domain-containing protein [Hyalangium sp. s54d21]
MKEATLKALELEALIEKYRSSSAKHGRAISEGHPRAANKEFDILVAIRKELRTRGEEGWQRLSSLLHDPEPGTRYWAATFLLEFMPHEAERVLGELASIPKSLVGFSAEMVLKKWKDGTFTPA